MAARSKQANGPDAGEFDLERLFELSQDILCISSSDGHFKKISPSVTDILGWTVEEFLATPYVRLVHPDDLDATMNEVIKQVHEGLPVLSFENRYLHKSGGYRILEWKSRPQSGGLMFATARDVTEQRATEAILAMRTEQIEAANQELEAFSYSVAHDLRAPLRGINSGTRILIEDHGPSLPEEARRILEGIAAKTNQMNRLIDDLLGFARIGQHAMRLVPIDMAALAQEVIASLDLGDRAPNIAFEVSDLPRAVGDPTLVRQVFVNLLSNAVKFSSKVERARIQILAGRGHGVHTYSVSDNGAGFDPAFAPKLFQAFQRFHDSREFEGTGIGLALVERIVSRHNGRVWAEGEVDRGATISFSLPAAEMPEVSD